MDTLIAMFFTLGLLGGHKEPPTAPPPEPPVIEQLRPPLQQPVLIQQRNQRIFLTNLWLRGMRNVRHPDDAALITVASRETGLGS